MGTGPALVVPRGAAEVLEVQGVGVSSYSSVLICEIRDPHEFSSSASISVIIVFTRYPPPAESLLNPGIPRAAF